MNNFKDHTSILLLLWVSCCVLCCKNSEETLQQNKIGKKTEKVVSPNIITIKPNKVLQYESGSTLNRYQNLSLSHFDRWFEYHMPAEDFDYFMKDLKISFGRKIRQHVWIPSSNKTKVGYLSDYVQEDPDRPGYASLDSLKELLHDLPQTKPPEQRILSFFPKGHQDTCFIGGETPFPEFMQRIDNAPALVKNTPAAAEMVVNTLKLGYHDFFRPRYYEPFNEPDLLTQRNSLFIALHRDIAKAIRKAGLDIKVGGPCNSIGYYYRDSYITYWDHSMVEFMDQAGDYLDFFSFHIYDYQSNGKWDRLSGLPLESVLDLYEAYTIKRFGKIKPLLVSEHGYYGTDYARHEMPAERLKEHFPSVEKPVEYHRGCKVSSLNGQLMSFISRPDTILKSVPYIRHHSESWQKFTISCLYEKDLENPEDYKRTSLFSFYELWQDLEGERVMTLSNNRDLQAVTFRQDDKLIVCLNNLSKEKQEMSLSVDQATADKASLVRHLQFSNGKPVTKTLENYSLESLFLNGMEAMVLTIPLKKVESEEEVKQQKVFPKTYYSEKLTTYIQPEGKTIKFPIKLSAKDRLYSELRIGVSRPHDLERYPKVTINDHELEIAPARSDDWQKDSKEYASTFIIPLKQEWLETENTVTVTYLDKGGAIGSVGIKVYEVEANTLQNKEE